MLDDSPYVLHEQSTFMQIGQSLIAAVLLLLGALLCLETVCLEEWRRPAD